MVPVQEQRQVDLDTRCRRTDDTVEVLGIRVDVSRIPNPILREKAKRVYAPRGGFQFQAGKLGTNGAGYDCHTDHDWSEHTDHRYSDHDEYNAWPEYACRSL